MYSKIAGSKGALKALTITGAFIGGQGLSVGLTEMKVASRKDFRGTVLTNVLNSLNSGDEISSVNTTRSSSQTNEQTKPVQSVQTIQTVTRDQALAVGMAIGSDSETMNTLMPGNSFTAEEKSSLLEKAVDIAQRPDLVQTLQNNLQYIDHTLSQYPSLELMSQTDSELFSSSAPAVRKVTHETPKKVIKKRVPQQPVYVSSPDEIAWENLRKTFPCAICNDVLAAPVIINCSHSFCGVCLDEMYQAGKATHITCPTCRKSTVEHGAEIYELNTDNAIVAAVDALRLQDSRVKSDWTERRASYFSIRKQRNAPQDIMSTAAAVGIDTMVMGFALLSELRNIHAALFVLVAAILEGVNLYFGSGN